MELGPFTTYLVFRRYSIKSLNDKAARAKSNATNAQINRINNFQKLFQLLAAPVSVTEW